MDVDADADADVDADIPLPLLPIEIWFYAMRFFKRSWWAVKE